MSEQYASTTVTRLLRSQPRQSASEIVRTLHEARLTITEIARLTGVHRLTLAKVRDGGAVTDAIAREIQEGYDRYLDGDRSYQRERIPPPRISARAPRPTPPIEGPRPARAPAKAPSGAIAAPGLRDRLRARRQEQRGGA